MWAKWKDMKTYYAAFIRVTLEVECPKCHKEQTMILDTEKFYKHEQKEFFWCTCSFDAHVKYKMDDEGMMEYFKYDSEGVGADLS